jgi:hypothetical protein
MKLNQAGAGKKQWSAPRVRRLGAGAAEGAAYRNLNTDSYYGS